jgi:hypothetical protein
MPTQLSLGIEMVRLNFLVLGLTTIHKVLSRSFINQSRYQHCIERTIQDIRARHVNEGLRLLASGLDPPM